jgi:O-acetyl-ADP-ribose deacetylase (regulator of RNase III)
MQWTIKHCDILDEPADVLVCSANSYLTLSGGVGGAFLLRYGDAMQRELEDFLSKSDRRYVPRGEVVRMPACGSPYKAVLHAVGVDAIYQTSPEVITAVVTKALEAAAELAASKVALAAIATGYGRLSLGDFANGLRPVMERKLPPIKEVVLCLQNQESAEILNELLG